MLSDKGYGFLKTVPSFLVASADSEPHSRSMRANAFMELAGLYGSSSPNKAAVRMALVSPGQRILLSAALGI